MAVAHHLGGQWFSGVSTFAQVGIELSICNGDRACTGTFPSQLLMRVIANL
jgi:hypothetical protein